MLHEGEEKDQTKLEVDIEASNGRLTLCKWKSGTPALLVGFLQSSLTFCLPLSL